MANFCPVTEDICISRGDSPVIPVVVREAGTNGALGSIVDITGYAFTLTVDPSSDPGTSANNLFSIAGVITDAANGRVEFQPTPVQTDHSPDQYSYDIQMVTTTPSVRTILSGTFEIKQDITKT